MIRKVITDSYDHGKDGRAGSGICPERAIQASMCMVRLFTVYNMYMPTSWVYTTSTDLQL